MTIVAADVLVRAGVAVPWMDHRGASPIRARGAVVCPGTAADGRGLHGLLILELGEEIHYDSIIHSCSVRPFDGTGL